MTPSSSGSGKSSSHCKQLLYAARQPAPAYPTGRRTAPHAAVSAVRRRSEARQRRVVGAFRRRIGEHAHPTLLHQPIATEGETRDWHGWSRCRDFPQQKNAQSNRLDASARRDTGRSDRGSHSCAPAGYRRPHHHCRQVPNAGYQRHRRNRAERTRTGPDR